MSDITKKTKKEAEPKPQEDLDPCVKPQSPESTRLNEDEEACDDGVK
jgi:hypothetical protein